MLEPLPVILRTKNVAAAPSETGAGVVDLTLEIEQGTLVQICGSVGSGRRTLFDLLGWLRLPDAGHVYLGDVSSLSLQAEVRSTLRNKAFGFLFSAPYLIPSFTLLENVAMPLFKVSGADAKEAKHRTEELLNFVGIQEISEMISQDVPLELQFRCALARALINFPQILLIEAPTAHGMERPRAVVWELVHRAIETFGVTVVWTDESPYPGSFDDRVIQMRAGRIVPDSHHAESKADAS